MIQFWLDNFIDLFKVDNLKFDSNKSQNYIKILNIITLLSIIVLTVLTIMKKKSVYFAVLVVIMSLTILIKSNINYSYFTHTTSDLRKDLSTLFDMNIFLTEPASMGNNIINVNSSYNVGPGDIIGLATTSDQADEINIVTTVDTNLIKLVNPLKKKYPAYTKIFKVADSSPNIVSAPDGNVSASQTETLNSDPMSMAVQNYPVSTLNSNRYDWNLELATGVNGAPNTYEYQGQPYGDLKCRDSTVSNPVGTINVTEYDQKPTMFGICNSEENALNSVRNQEATVSQRVNDLLFHKGNSQYLFTPTSVDTMPNDQEGFANWCYRSPTNLVNPKYGSIFVNDPEKLKLVMKLARATGTENGR